MKQLSDDEITQEDINKFVTEKSDNSLFWVWSRS